MQKDRGHDEIDQGIFGRVVRQKIIAGSLFSLKYVFRYPTGTKLAGIVFVHRFGWSIETSLKSGTRIMEELFEDLTLKTLVIMIHQWGKLDHGAEAKLQSDLSNPDGFVQRVVRRGAKIYRCTGRSKPDLCALRIILGGRSFVPEVQREPINKGSELERTAVRPVEPSKEKPELGEGHNSYIKELRGSAQEAVDKEVEELRRELEEQKSRAKQEADVFKKRIAEMQSKEADMFKKHVAEMQSKEESIRQEVSQELEGQKRKAQEADELRKCITEMQSKLEEDRHRSGTTSATHDFRHTPTRSKVFLMGSLTHLALQRVYPSTDLHPNSLIGSMTHFTGRNMNNGCKAFRKMA